MRKIEFDSEALKELNEWIKVHPRTAFKIIEMVQEISKTPFEGKGKPEPLKHNLKGSWSRRISDEHRLIYQVDNDTINIISCKGHYA